jgi:hypothetical protein
MAGPATLYQAGDHASRPASGSGCVLYSCTDHDLVYRDDGSSWTTFMTLVGGSGGDIATDTIWDAAGDLAVGTGANTAAKLAIGAAGSTLQSNGTTAGWAGGPWTDYTPTLTATTTNPTLGSSTVAGRYRLLDAKTGIVRVEFAVTTGGAWNAGSGEYRFSLPAGWTASGTSFGAAHLLDSGTARFAGVAGVFNGGTVIGPIIFGDATEDRVLKHNVPVTWATGDSVHAQILVELA